MEAGRKEEGEAVLGEALCRGLGGKFDRDPEGFEDIGRTRLRGDGAVAMLGDGDSRGGADEGDGGGDVEGVEPVAPGATHIEDLALEDGGRQRKSDGAAAEFRGEPGDFRGALALGGEGSQEGGLGLDRLGLPSKAGDDLGDVAGFEVLSSGQ